MSKVTGGGLIAIAFLLGLMVGSLLPVKDRAKLRQRRFQVESFTTDLTIRIQCSGDCDLAAMISEAREAAEK